MWAVIYWNADYTAYQVQSWYSDKLDAVAVIDQARRTDPRWDIKLFDIYEVA